MSLGCSPPQDDEQGVRGHQQQDPPGRLLPGGSRLRLRGQGTEEPQQNHRWVRIVRTVVTGILHCHCHRCILSLHCLNSTNVDYSTTRSGPCRPALRRLLPKGELFQETAQCQEPFTKPPLLQENRLTGGGSPNLMDLVERKFPVERKLGAANSFHLLYS